MKESYIEGVATHDDPESCVHSREGMGEALTGACVGGVLSPEIRTNSERRRCFRMRKATPVHALWRAWQGSAGSETSGMRRHSIHENREIHRLAVEDGSTVRIGKPKGVRR